MEDVSTGNKRGEGVVKVIQNVEGKDWRSNVVKERRRGKKGKDWRRAT